MRPLRLTLENFLSYRGEHVVEFDGVTLAVLSGPNGAGKSSLVDAMRFALFGHARGGLDGVITEGEQACRVEFAFALGDETYLVSRHRSKKGAGTTLLFFQMISSDGAAVLDGKTIAETQARIEQTLRLTDELFTVTACANQGNAAAFSQAKPAERKQVLAEILDLGTWERRAVIARQMGRDLAARISSEQARHEGLQAAAAGADVLRATLAEIDATQGTLAGQVGQAEADLAQGQEAKEALLRDREADRARRRELEDLAARVTSTQATIDETATRISHLQTTVSDKAALLACICRAEGALTYSQELEGRRQEAERLDGEMRLLRQQIETAEQNHTAEVKRLEMSVSATREKHQAAVDALTERIGTLEAQAETLERVPCLRRHHKALAEDCELLTLAIGAKASLPGIEEQRAEAIAAIPWSHAEQELARLREARPGARLKDHLADQTVARKQVVYDPNEHAEAKRQGGRLQELQRGLGTVERAEVQMTAEQAHLRAMQAEANQVIDRKAALEKELGPERRWDAMLDQVERTIKEARWAIGDLQARIQSLRQERGGLEERLRAAEAAAKEAEELASALREGQRRLQVLKILAQAFGKEGIPALLIEKAIPDLEAVANDVLSTLTDGRMSLHLETQRPTQTKTLEETLNIRITDERGERPYENYSGGEAMRVDLGLRIALSVLLASRAGARCELLVLDETCAPLDAQGRALFVDCLQRVAERFATILVVSHVPELQDAFPVCLQVTKDQQGSHIEVTTR